MTSLYLKQLSLEMNAQDNRATQLPLFVVQNKVKRYGEWRFCDNHERKEDVDDAELCESCIELQEKGEDMPEECDSCTSDAFNWFEWEWEFNLRPGVFLTAAACDRHIEANRHHYGDSARSYGISAYHNVEMGNLLAWLSSLSTEDGKPVSHYRV